VTFGKVWLRAWRVLSQAHLIVIVNQLTTLLCVFSKGCTHGQVANLATCSWNSKVKTEISLQKILQWSTLVHWWIGCAVVLLRNLHKAGISKVNRSVRSHILDHTHSNRQRDSSVIEYNTYEPTLITAANNYIYYTVNLTLQKLTIN